MKKEPLTLEDAYRIATINVSKGSHRAKKALDEIIEHYLYVYSRSRGYDLEALIIDLQAMGENYRSQKLTRHL